MSQRFFFNETNGISLIFWGGLWLRHLLTRGNPDHPLRREDIALELHHLAELPVEIDGADIIDLCQVPQSFSGNDNEIDTRPKELEDIVELGKENAWVFITPISCNLLTIPQWGRSVKECPKVLLLLHNRNFNLAAICHEYLLPKTKQRCYVNYNMYYKKLQAQYRYFLLLKHVNKFERIHIDHKLLVVEAWKSSIFYCHKKVQHFTEVLFNFF